MTAVRLLAVAPAADGSPVLVQRIRARFAASDRPLSVFTLGKLTVVVEGPMIALERGLVVGDLFDRRRACPVRDLDAEEQHRIIVSAGRHLVEAYWGGYVALLDTSDDASHVVRAPFGEVPCYRVRTNGATVVATDVELLIQAGVLQPRIEWSAVARELAWRDLRSAETCLEGVTALQGGERLRIDADGMDTERLWTPWDHIATGNGRTVALVDDVRRATLECVTARTSPYDHVLLLLSGGLDSSIVAASLANGGASFALATMVTRDASGDERHYGRLMAHAVGRRLHEALRDVRRIDPMRSPAARLPRPAGRLFEQETARIAGEVAEHVGAQAIITGGGGDNVFCSLQSAAPAADRLLTSGADRAFFATAREISQLAPASLFAVVTAAVGRTRPSRRRSPVTPDLSFLSAEARASIRMSAPHSWLEAPRGALPGQAAHIKLMAIADSFLQGYDPQAAYPMIAPLLGQPLVEACLAIPSWHWLASGRNRALARAAFADELPPMIRDRRSKGSPDSFLGEIYERHHAALRDMVLDGLLVANGVIDSSAVARAFKASGSMAPIDFGRLLRLADVESWARSWASSDRA